MRRRGTSLIELLIVMVLIGIMTAIAAPRLLPSASGAVEQNARLLAQGMDMARTRAYSSRALVRVVATDTIWQSFLDQNRDSVIAENATERTAFGVMSDRVLESGVIFGRGNASRIPGDTSAQVGTRRVNFGTRGTTEPFGTGTVLYLSHISDATAVSAVEITPAANVKVWRWVDGAWQ